MRGLEFRRSHLSCRIRYLKPGQMDSRDLAWDLAADAFEHYVGGGRGDVLIFMPGGYEIQKTLQLETPSNPRNTCCPFHGELPMQEQDAAVSAYDHPKVVVAPTWRRPRSDSGN